MARSYKILVGKSELYGNYVRASFDKMSAEEMMQVRKEIRSSLLAFRSSDDGQVAFLEVMVGAGSSAELVKRELERTLSIRGYCKS